MKMKKHLFPLCMGFFLLSSCNDSLPEEVPQVFKLTSVNFTPASDNFEKVFGELRETVYENKSDAEKLFTTTRKEYRKHTSFFHMPETAIPSNSNIAQLLSAVPEIDCEPKIVGLTSSKFPLSFNEKQTMTDSLSSGSITIRVPANSSLKHTIQMIGYKVKATYELVLTNETTGKELTLSGDWEGIQEVSVEEKME